MRLSIIAKGIRTAVRKYADIECTLFFSQDSTDEIVETKKKETISQKMSISRLLNFLRWRCGIGVAVVENDLTIVVDGRTNSFGR